LGTLRTKPTFEKAARNYNDNIMKWQDW